MKNLKNMARSALLLAACVFSANSLAGILVYDHNTNNGFAVTAANNVSGDVTVGDASTFNGLLTGQIWDIVLVDVPSTIPASGWGDLVNYVAGGGLVVMSYWEWNAEPALAAAFGASSTSTFSLGASTLTDLGTSSVFTGVSMPNSDWSNAWSDDGDGFGLSAGSIGLAALSGVADPVMILGNEGRTIGAFVLDEAGGTWIGDGSAVQLWENMIGLVLDGPGEPVPLPGSGLLLVVGLLALRLGARRIA